MAAKGQGCPRCGGMVFAAEQQLAKGTVRVICIVIGFKYPLKWRWLSSTRWHEPPQSLRTDLLHGASIQQTLHSPRWLSPGSQSQVAGRHSMPVYQSFKNINASSPNENKINNYDFSLRCGTRNASTARSATGHWTRCWHAMALTRRSIAALATLNSSDPRASVTATLLPWSALIQNPRRLLSK